MRKIIYGVAVVIALLGTILGYGNYYGGRWEIVPTQVWDIFPNIKIEMVSVDNRDSLNIIFSKHPDVTVIMSDTNDFYLYVQSVKYSLDGIKDGDVVEWEGPDKRLSGRLTLLSTRNINDQKCRTFYHQFKIDGKAFDGEAEACLSTDDIWKVKSK